MIPKFKVMPFDGETADIMIGDVEIGYIEKILGEHFKNATSYARVPSVDGYAVTLWETKYVAGADEDLLVQTDFKTRAECTAHVRKVLKLAAEIAAANNVTI